MAILGPSLGRIQGRAFWLFLGSSCFSCVLFLPSLAFPWSSMVLWGPFGLSWPLLTPLRSLQDGLQGAGFGFAPPGSSMVFLWTVFSLPHLGSSMFLLILPCPSWRRFLAPPSPSRSLPFWSALLLAPPGSSGSPWVLLAPPGSSWLL